MATDFNKIVKELERTINFNPSRNLMVQTIKKYAADEFEDKADLWELAKKSDEELLAIIETIKGYYEDKLETVYKIGDKFKIEGYSGTFILAQVKVSHCSLINLSNGNRFQDSIKVRDVRNVTQEELNEMSSQRVITKV